MEACVQERLHNPRWKLQGFLFSLSKQWAKRGRRERSNERMQRGPRSSRSLSQLAQMYNQSKRASRWLVGWEGKNDQSGPGARRGPSSAVARFMPLCCMREVFSAATQHCQLLTYFVARCWVRWFLHGIEVPCQNMNQWR